MPPLHFSQQVTLQTFHKSFLQKLEKESPQKKQHLAWKLDWRSVLTLTLSYRDQRALFLLPMW